MTPSRVCIGSTETVTLQGRGFTNKLLPGKAACRFKTGQGLTYGESLCCLSEEMYIVS